MNEDALALEEDPAKGLLLAVADGLGGLADGEVASQLAVETLLGSFRQADPADRAWIEEAARAANAAVFAVNLIRPLSGQMATTLTACLIRPPRLLAAHVGDSRLYRLRGGRLERLTTDHSSSRHVLTRAAGLDPKVEIDVLESGTEPGDVYLVCSDGLHGTVPEEVLRRSLGAGGAPEACCRALVEAANSLGGPDNITLAVARIGEEAA